MPHANVTRTSREISLGWAEANPALFVQSVKAFQQETPITEWRHFIDLSREHRVELIAVRRDQPYDSVAAYVCDGSYLRETGFDL